MMPSPVRATREIGGHEYQIGRLEPMAQFHVARRLGPVYNAFGSMALASASGASPAAKLQPIVEAVSKLSDEDSEYVIQTCLAVVKRYDADKWCAVRASSGKVMFMDIDLMTMLTLVWAVVQENLASFFPAAPPASPTAG